MSHPAADILRQAADLNAADRRRRGNVVHLPADCEVVVAGDLHGNRRGLQRILSWAALGQRRTVPRCLILQEIIHGPQDPTTGHDLSIEVLLLAAREKIAHPDGLVFLMGNHDGAQLTGNEITRGGQPSCQTFVAGVEHVFAKAASEVLLALEQFALSMPLVIRCPNGVLISHSLPSIRANVDACMEVLDRPYRLADLQRGGGVYEWTWSRRHTPEHLDALAKRLAARWFIIGHQHPPTGHQWVGHRTVVLSSDNQHGCVMRFGANGPLTAETAAAAIRPIVALGSRL